MKSVIAEWRKYDERYQLIEGGEVVSFSVVYVAPQRFGTEVPYVVAVIKLNSGELTTSQIVDCVIDDVKIGVKVEPVFRKIGKTADEEALTYATKFRLTK